MYQMVCAIGRPDAPAGSIFDRCSAGARAQQAVVVVDEVHEAVVEALVVGHVGVGRVDAHRLAQHLGQRPARRAPGRNRPRSRPSGRGP